MWAHQHLLPQRTPTYWLSVGKTSYNPLEAPVHPVLDYSAVVKQHLISPAIRAILPASRTNG